MGSVWVREDGDDAGDRADALFATLTAGAKDHPASRVLDALVGDWHLDVEWEPIVGHGLRRSEGRCETRWTFDDRVLESRHLLPDGVETSRHTYAYDPTVGDYVAFAVHVLSTSFVLERGHFDAPERNLVLEGWEPVPGGRPSVHFRRTIHLEDGDHLAMGITYPDDPPGRYGPMHVAYRRIG